MTRIARRRRPVAQRGFTLIEAVVVLALTGIVAAMVGVFIARPIDAYVDLARRAELSDNAEVAVRRIAREIGLALPNSVRVDGTGNNIEFLPISVSGRYRAAPAADGSGDFFDVDQTADNSFDILGPAVVLPSASQLVVYNLGIPNAADAYTGETRRPIVGSGSATHITYDVGAGQFPYPSPGNRFQVVTTPVTFACVAGAGGTGSLRRYTGYPIQVTQPTDVTAAPLVGLSAPQSALLAVHVESCSFSYAKYTTDASVRTGLVTMRMTMASGGEKLTFVHQVHVDNSP